jgi:TRAP-type C4-dicarboxylate transport system permease small subunit
MFDISAKTLQLLMAICAIAAINWGMTAHDQNVIPMITKEKSTQNLIYYAIAVCGVLVLGKMYNWF